MAFPQKHEDQPVAPALSRASRQEESHARPLVSDSEDVETAIANLELDRVALDERRDASSPRYQGAIALGTPAMNNPTPLAPPELRDATKTITVARALSDGATVQPAAMTRSCSASSPTAPAADGLLLGGWHGLLPHRPSLAPPAWWETCCPEGMLDLAQHFTAAMAGITSLTSSTCVGVSNEPRVGQQEPLASSYLSPPPSPPGPGSFNPSDNTESVDPETGFLREARPQNPTTRPVIRLDRLNLGTPEAEPSSLAALFSIASSESGDFLEPSDTLRLVLTGRHFVKWQSWARDEKILMAKRKKITEATRAAPDRLREAQRKSLSLSSETSSMSDVAPSPDPPMPEYATFGRESSISPPDAHFTARAPIPEPPPRDVPPGTRSPPALNIDALPPRDVPPSPPAVSSAFTEDVGLDAAIRASLLDAPPPRRHDDPTLQTLPPRRHGCPPSPPSSIATSDVPPESVDSSDFYPYRKTFSCDIQDLPTELASHPFHYIIECLLKSEPDSTNRYWCRRSTYTEDNFEQWAEWSPPSKTHRDERACMKDLDTETLLKAPALLATDKKVLEDAWGTYRPYLLDQIQQALSVGCDWKRILQRLNLAFSDPKRGYPRLEQYVGQALRDQVLIKFPLLHADVLIYQLDRTYSEKGTHNPNYTRWSRTFLRESGEDVSSLANRVESAYLDMLTDGPGTEGSRKFTKETIYHRHDAESCRNSNNLYERFRECLRNDVDNPARGLYLELMCEQEEDRLLAEYEKNRLQLKQ